jgi:hypothetical protein
MTYLEVSDRASYIKAQCARADPWRRLPGPPEGSGESASKQTMPLCTFRRTVPFIPAMLAANTRVV